MIKNIEERGTGSTSGESGLEDLSEKVALIPKLI